jgi:hypothetical protein
MRGRVSWLAVLIVGLSPNVWAGVSGWTVPVAIVALEANQQGRFTLRLNLEKSASGCRSPDGFYADYGRAGSELMYRTTLDALLHARRVQLFVTGACDLDGYSEISSVRILP